MLYKNYFNLILILIGCVVAIYAQAGEEQNIYILVIGIAILMYGLFRLSQKIPNKSHKDHNNEDHI